MNRIAAFCAGNSGIILPCVVLSASINTHNPDIFDFYLILDEEDEISGSRELCESYGIKVILTSDMGMESIHSTMYDLYQRKQDPNGGRFPCGLFYNYCAPDYFYQKGYQFSVKYDYDMLCTNTYNINNILPDEEQIASVFSFNNTVYLRDYSVKCIKCLIDFGYLGNYPENTCNAGFIVYNNRLHFEQNLFERFARIYCILYDDVCGKKVIIDQDALGILFSQKANNIKKLTMDYNYRTYEKRMFQNVKIRNIHYNGRYKPWIPIQPFIDGHVNSVYFFSRIWLRFASHIPEIVLWLAKQGVDISHLDELNMAKIMEQEEKIAMQRANLKGTYR